MTVQELKKAIATGALSDEFLVIIAPKSRFIVDQYISELCSVKGLKIANIESLAEAMPSAMDLFADTESDLRILRTEVFETELSDFSELTNTIVVCDKIKDKKLASRVSRFVVEFPKPEPWATVAFLCNKYPAIPQNMIEELVKNVDDDYRAINELDKVACFPEEEQGKIFGQLLDESDFFVDNFFAFSDALQKKDRAVVGEFLKHRDICDLEPVGIVQRMLNVYKAMLLANYTNLSAADIGISDKQLYYYKKFSGINPDYLEEKIKFLSSIDTRLKLGEIDLTYDRFLDYILCQIMY